jgi:uncharacterized protein
MVDSTTLQVLLVVFFATLIRSTFGFGEALIAVPLLALTIPIEIATPLAVLLSITVAAVVVVQDWRQIHLRSAGWLLAPPFPGILPGILLLTSVHQHLVKGLLAIVIMAFSSYALVGRKPPALESDNRTWLLICGFLAGVLGGAYGMNGPPWLSMARCGAGLHSTFVQLCKDISYPRAWSQWRDTGSRGFGFRLYRTTI